MKRKPFTSGDEYDALTKAKEYHNILNELLIRKTIRRSLRRISS
jgi:hypothetical protein